MKKLLSLGMIVVLTGCAGANISSQIRESGAQGTAMKLRCVDFSTGNENKINAALKNYDGWKMVYASEYTTANKSDTAAVMCFEKPVSE